ncbi:MAG: hypothetical protein QM790_11175 [Nibricoccus sp.]
MFEKVFSFAPHKNIRLSGLVLAIAGVLVGQTLRADFKDDIDFTKLKGEYGNSLPDGSGVRMLQVEYMRNGAWATQPAGELAGKNMSYGNSTFGGYSGHAYEVGCFLGGNATSITPNLPGWLCFEATNYCAQASLLSGYSIGPMQASWDIENHSWGGNDMIFGLCNLQRMDYRIERDNVISVVGIDNGSSMSMMMANAYNVISVGTSTGDHPHCGSTMEVRGRIKPELVGTATWTSYATPIVASCASILVGETQRTGSLAAARSPLVIKALLMAGATKDEFPGWQHSSTAPLDVNFGAGEVNIYNSYKALVAGRKSPNSGALSVDGWDDNTTSGRQLYFISVPAGKKLTLSAVLAWYRHVQPGSNWSSPGSVVSNLDLALWEADGSFNLQGKLAESVSSIDNVEHIYEKNLTAGMYALEVISPVGGERYGLAWKGTLADDGSGSGSGSGSGTTPTDAFADNSFEARVLQSGSFQYNPSGSAWAFNGSSGLTTNNSAFTSGNAAAPAGNQITFIQLSGSIQQTINVSGGTYTINAQAAQRASYQYQNQVVDVYVDGAKVGSLTASGTGFSAASTAPFAASAGSHEIKLVGTAAVDSTMFLDSLTITAASSSGSGGGSSSSGSLSDGSFETVGLGGGAFQYNPGGSAWRFSDRSGIAANNSGFTCTNPGAPAGNQVGFIQMSGTIEQSVTLAAGDYRVSAQAAQRATYQYQTQVVDVYVDGAKVGSLCPSGTSYSAVSTNAFNVSAGSHTIRLAGTATMDSTMFLDGIAVSSGGSSSTAGSNVAVNASGFESPYLGTNNFSAFAYNPTSAGWSFAGRSGVAGNNSGFTSDNPAAPQGTQVAFLQGATANVSQAITFNATGTHSLVVSAAKRGGQWNVAVQVVNVCIDGTVVGSFTPQNTSYETFTIPFSTAAGQHTLSFVGSVNADATALIDDVVIIGP